MTKLIPVSPDLPANLADEIRRANKFLLAEIAPATRRAYASDFRTFSRWCQKKQLVNLPASSEAVALFISGEAAQGIKPATIIRRLAAIRYAHESAGHQSPTRELLVTATNKGIRRSVATAPEQKRPATVELVRRLVSHCPDTLAGLRDKAMILTGFAGAMRRSELVALQVADIQFMDKGMRVTIRNSKTDQEGIGQVIPIYKGSNLRVVETLQLWLQRSNITQGPIFRPFTKSGRLRDKVLSDRSVALILKHYVTAEGLDPSAYAGHSLRSGFLTSAAQRGASIFKMLEVSRHKKVDTLRSYVRMAEEFDDHAGKDFL